MFKIYWDRAATSGTVYWDEDNVPMPETQRPVEIFSRYILTIEKDSTNRVGDEVMYGVYYNGGPNYLITAFYAPYIEWPEEPLTTTDTIAAFLKNATEEEKGYYEKVRDNLSKALDEYFMEEGMSRLDDTCPTKLNEARGDWQVICDGDQGYTLCIMQTSGKPHKTFNNKCRYAVMRPDGSFVADSYGPYIEWPYGKIYDAAGFLVDAMRDLTKREDGKQAIMRMGEKIKTVSSWFNSTVSRDAAEMALADYDDHGVNDYDWDDWDDDRVYNWGRHRRWADDYEDERNAELTDEDLKEIEEYCKSDTIVFHLDDPSTVMLKPIYEGQGWDVFTESGYSKKRKFFDELIRRHDKIMCLGHGTPAGLIGGIIDSSKVDLLKEKKIFALWCHAATFFKNNGFEGQGIFCSDNCPSEVWECKYACDADVGKEWIYDNMFYLSDCIKSVLDDIWDNPEEACRKAKEAYSKAKADTEDEKKVVEYNTNTLQVV